MRGLTDAETIEQLIARCDALTWVATALIQSHQDLEVVRWRWHARRMADERAGRTQGEGAGYKQTYMDELAVWTETLDCLIAAREQRQDGHQVWSVDRATATALIDQLCRELPSGGTAQADDFDYGWFRERVGSVAEHCRAVDEVYIWQYALWHLDRAGLMPEGVAPIYRG